MDEVRWDPTNIDTPIPEGLIPEGTSAWEANQISSLWRSAVGATEEALSLLMESHRLLIGGNKNLSGRGVRSSLEASTTTAVLWTQVDVAHHRQALKNKIGEG